MADANSTAHQKYEVTIDRLIAMSEFIKREGYDSFFDWGEKRSNHMWICYMLDELTDAAASVKGGGNHV